MSKRVATTGRPGPKLDKEALDAQRKEKYGFANLTKEQTFRSTTQGEMKELQDRIRELTDTLEDRKNANRLLATENARLKKLTTDLQFQLLNKPTPRGESAALRAMREMARQYRSQEQLTSASADKLVADLMAQNQEAVEEMQRMGEEREGLEAQLASTREALSSATAEVGAYREAQSALLEEKEVLMGAAQRREEEHQQALSALATETAALQQQLTEMRQLVEAARLETEVARREGEAALRTQRGELEAAAHMQRQAVSRQMEGKISALQGLLDQAHASLRSLQQTNKLEPQWTLHEVGQPPLTLPPPALPVPSEAAGAPAPAAPPTTSSLTTTSTTATSTTISPHPVVGTEGQSGPDATEELSEGNLERQKPAGEGDQEVGKEAEVEAGNSEVVAAVGAGLPVAPYSRAASKRGAGAFSGADFLEQWQGQDGEARRVAPAAAQAAAGGEEPQAASGSPRAGGGGGARGPGASPEVESREGAAVSAPSDGEAHPTGNTLELLFHDAALHPGVLGLPAANFWALLRLYCPGLGLRHIAFSAPASPTTLPLLHAYRLHYPDDQALLTAVASGAARVMLYNLQSTVIGVFGCPRLAPPPPGAAAASTATPTATAATGGGGGAMGVPDGVLERVLVVACRDEHNCPSVELFCMDEQGRPTRPFQGLSAPWRLQLPEALAEPLLHEFCIDTQSLHRLQADAARASGLFDTAGRVFKGRGDGHLYQVWRLTSGELRRKATFKALSQVLVEPTEDPWAASVSLAAASLPLAAALTTPTHAALELTNVRRLLSGQSVVRLYEPGDELGTKTLACRTVKGEKLVCGVRVTARLAREPQVSEQLLGALQPGLQAGSGTPSLPPLHWLALLGAEELVLVRLLGELRQGVGAAVGRVMTLTPRDGGTVRELEGVLVQLADAVQHKQRQLSEVLVACQRVAGTAAAANPQEAQLARARMESIRIHVARSLAELLAFFRQRSELYRLCAATWHFITAFAGPDDPVSALPTTTSQPQARVMAAMTATLVATLAALTPPGVTAAELLTPAAGAVGAVASIPFTLLLPSPAAEVVASSDQTAPAGMLKDAARELESTLRPAVDAVTAAASELGEALRLELSAGCVDDVAAGAGAQVRLATLAAPVTAALVSGLAGLCQAGLAASLADPEAMARLREQIMTAAGMAVSGGGVGPALGRGGGGAVAPFTGTVPSLMGGAGCVEGVQVHMLAQLAQQLQEQAAAAASAVTKGAVNIGSVPAQLSSALQSLQWLAGAIVRAAPAPVAASRHSAAAWLKASVRLRLQLGVMATSWSAAAVAAAGHALLLGGHRLGAVSLVLEVMGREVDRVLDGTKATLESIRANRSVDDAVLADALAPLSTELTSHAATAVTSCFWLATQMLMTPVLIYTHRPPPPPPQQQPSQSPSSAPLAPHLVLDAALGAATAPADAPDTSANINDGSLGDGRALGAGAVAGVGACYSASLHVSSWSSYTMLTLGTLSSGGSMGPDRQTAVTTTAASADGAASTSRPIDPSLAPLGHPMLTSWQPHGSVLYLDIGRLNAATAPTTPVGPATEMDTSRVPNLMAAVELLGWNLRHGEEYFSSGMAAASAHAAVVTGGGGTPGKAPSSVIGTALSTAPAPPPSTGRGSNGPSRIPSPPGSPALSVAASARSILPDSPAAAAALSVDPAASLSEAKAARQVARDCDMAIVVGGRLADAGSVVKWLSQRGVLVLTTEELQLAGPAGAAAAAPPGLGPVQSDGSADSAPRRLARRLVGLLAVHQLHGATARALTATTGPPSSGAVSSSSTPRPATISHTATPPRHLSASGGQLPPPPPPPTPPPHPTAPSSPPTPSLQPLAALTFLYDMAFAKPVATACEELASRVDITLQALQAAFATSGPLVAHSEQLVRHVSRQLAQQKLIIEGLLTAPELMMTMRLPSHIRQHGSMPPALSANAGGVGIAPSLSPPLQGVSSLRPPPSPALSRQSSGLGRMRSALPSITPRDPSRRTSLAGGGGGGGTVSGVGMPPSPTTSTTAPPAAVAPLAADEVSTESEDEEVGVAQLVLQSGGGQGRGGVAGRGAPAASLLPDVPDADSDAASIASASTIMDDVSFGGSAGGKFVGRRG